MRAYGYEPTMCLCRRRLRYDVAARVQSMMRGVDIKRSAYVQWYHARQRRAHGVCRRAFFFFFFMPGRYASFYYLPRDNDAPLVAAPPTAFSPLPAIVYAFFRHALRLLRRFRYAIDVDIITR